MVKKAIAKYTEELRDRLREAYIAKLQVMTLEQLQEEWHNCWANNDDE